MKYIHIAVIDCIQYPSKLKRIQFTIFRINKGLMEAETINLL